MPTGRAVTVSTVTLSMASTHLSRVLVQALAVVTLAVATTDEAFAVGVVAHAAATVTCSCVGAHHSLSVAAQVFALSAGELAVLLVLAGFSKPALITLALATVTQAMTATGLPIICCADPVVAFAPRPVVLPRVSDLAYANPAFTLSPPTADQAVRGLAASLRGLGGELAYSTHLPQ